LITFDGDLEGSQEVLGCCPNAGPFPEYIMTLNDDFPEEMLGEHEGQIFMNFFMFMSEPGKGKKMHKAYIVQFWWTDANDYFIQIKGGDIEENKKTKSLTVTFNDVPCEIWINDLLLEEPVPVTFTLTRVPL
jgi:hypothetical protein